MRAWHPLPVSWGSASWAVPRGCSLSGLAPCSLFLEDSLLRSTAAVVLTCCAAHQGLRRPAGFSRVLVRGELASPRRCIPILPPCSCVTEQAAGGAPSLPSCLEGSYPHHTPRFLPPSSARGHTALQGQGCQRLVRLHVSGSGTGRCRCLAPLTSRLWPLSHRPKRTSPAQPPPSP